MKRSIVLSYIFGVCAIIACVLSAVLFLSKNAYSECIGSISTIVSIVLSIVATINSYITEKKTDATLNKIEMNNQKLVDCINHLLSKDNYDENNIKNLYK